MIIKYLDPELDECEIEIENHPHPWIDHDQIAREIAEADWNGQEELRDPDEWPRTYKVFLNGYKVDSEVDMSYLPCFSTIKQEY